MDDFALNDLTLILGIDIDADMWIETHINYDKLLILKEKIDRMTYLKFMQNLRTIFLKLKTQWLNSNKKKIEGLNMIFVFPFI
jgi:hypothetical protein